MAYRLTSGGTAAKYVTIPTCSLAGDFDITLVATQLTNGNFLLAGTGIGGDNGLDLYRNGSGKYQVYINNSSVITSTISASNSQSAPDTIRVTRSSGIVTLRVNGTADGTASNSNTLRIDCLFFRAGWFTYGNMAFYTMSITAASGNRFYDASASGGVGTILPDIINSANNGTQAGTWPSDNSEWVFYSSGATYQLTAHGGTFTYSGQTAALNRGFKLAAQGGTYSYTGASANLSYTTATIYRLDALGASYNYVGASASLLRGFVMDAQGGAYSYSGSDAVLRRGFKLSANGGAYNYSGADASLTYVAGPTVYRLTALGVTYVYSGADATLTATGVAPAANPNAFHITAQISGPQNISAMIGGTLTNNAKIGGNMTISARLSQ